MKQHFGDEIEITWKSFLLRTEPKTTARPKFVAYTEGWTRMADMEPRATFRPWSNDTTNDPPSSSLPAQVAHKVVAGNWPDKSEALHWRLLEAYFAENRTISDWDVLTDVAVEAGVDRDEFASISREQRQSASQLVIDEHNGAINQSITAVPTVVINQVLPVPGAQESATYISWIERLLEREANG